MRKRVVLGVLVVLVASLTVTVAALARSSAGTIDIGGVFDKSGPTAASQIPVLHAMETYFHMVNDAGGVHGKKINFIEKDDLFNPTLELSAVKSLINDDHAVFITGIGNSSGFASVIPVFNQTKIAGLSNQGTLKTGTWPFQPWFFEGNCNYADQGEVALAYEMTHLGLKSLKGVSVGIAGIVAASGQEWISNLDAKVKALGGTPVDQSPPPVIVNADIQAQAFATAKVKFILMHAAVPGGIALLKSMDKFGVNVPISGSFGVTQNVVWEGSPYNTAKNFVGVNCYTPPEVSKSAEAKLLIATSQKYGVAETDYQQMNYALGWVNAKLIVAALKNVKGDYTGVSVRKALESVKSLDVGDLAPTVSLGPKCHIAIQQVRPYTYSYTKKSVIPIGTYQQWAKSITHSYVAPGTCGRPRGSG